MRLRSVALPVEHGGWSFLAEPLVLALAVAPSPGGAAIAVATAAGFLLRHPGRMAWKNRDRIATIPRYRLARDVAAGYGLVAAAGLGAAAWLAGPRALLPFALAAPFLVLFAAYDLRHESRRLLPELLAPAGIAVAAPAIALAGGWSAGQAIGLWLLLGLRSVPTVLYVRARLRLEKGRPPEATRPVAAHAAALAGGGGLAAVGLAPLLSLVALAALLARCAVGLSSRRRPVKAKQVGLSEIAWGALFVALAIAGYRLGF
ncbi:MAG: YwiC-like family protein [Gemmatimonadota bacterium]|nr:YwiC-like family protein [Gemmatimonadota bacterium]